MTTRVTYSLALGVGTLLGLALPSVANGWGANGHRIVAQIGEDHLSEEAGERIDSIAGDRSLAQISTWPDFIRSEQSWNCSQPWHFLTVEDGQAIEEALRKPGSFRGCEVPPGVDLPQNVVQAIDFFSAILEGDPARLADFEALADANDARFYAGSARLSALSFLVHLVGDVHQPLHVGRGGDLGGNRVSVNVFGEVSNLHTAWDSGLIGSENLSYSEFVEFLEAEEGEMIDLGNLTDAKVWAEGSREVRSRVYEIYGATSQDNHLPDLSYPYAHDQMSLLRESLYRGGRRLAARLNGIFAEY